MPLKKRLLLYGSFTMLFFILMLVIGSIWDYPISEALYPGSESSWGQFFAAFGKNPSFLCVSIAGCLLFVRRKSINRKWAKLIGVASFCVVVMSVILVTHETCDCVPQMPKWAAYLINTFLTGTICLAVLMLSRNTPTKTAVRFALAIAAASCFTMVIVSFVKIPWGRARMRYIYATGNESYFSPWWQIGTELKQVLVAAGASKEEFQSFPSGHSSCSLCLMPIALLLPTLQKKLLGKEAVFFGVSAVFVLLTDLSRICMGAHFLSDVAMASIIQLLVSGVCIWLFYYNKKFFNFWWNLVTTLDNPFEKK